MCPWTLWNQSKLASEVVARFSRLRRDPDFQRFCPCGKRKPPVSLCKFDAPQFFKSANATEAYEDCRRLLEYYTQNLQFNAVVVISRHPKGTLARWDADGLWRPVWAGQSRIKSWKLLCNNNKKHSKQLITFDFIDKALQYAAEDVYMGVGHSIVERLAGLPMGGSLSEPVLVALIAASVHRLHTDKKAFAASGFKWRNWTVQETGLRNMPCR